MTTSLISLYRKKSRRGMLEKSIQVTFILQVSMILRQHLRTHFLSCLFFARILELPQHMSPRLNNPFQEGCGDIPFEQTVPLYIGVFMYID